MPNEESDRSRLRGLDPLGLIGTLSRRNTPPPVIPGWRILGVAGEGGFGTVWRAQRDRDGVLAAIKVATPTDTITIERIEEEASALQALEHPHIVRLLESGPLLDTGDPETDGGLYLAMEYLPGAPLAQQIPLHGFTAARALELFRPIAQAVAHAHGRGILHRDLKPSNILFAPAAAAAPDAGPGPPIPKVADFGLARPIHERTQALSLTATGIIAGTAEYLPPEAYRAAYHPAPTADIYALGVVLHELLTGAPPRGAWQPVSLQKRVDVRLDELLRRALHPDPDRRFPAVVDLLARLDEIEKSPPRYAGSPSISPATRAVDACWTLLTAGVCLAVVGVLMRLSLVRWQWPIDLVGDHSLRLGGFQALAILLPFVGLASLWQISRLFIFRKVPLREALPSPFGLQLGTSRTAAAVVFGTQLVCVIFTLTGLLHIWLETGRDWLRPGDGAWRQGLAVTISSTDAIVNPWSWDRFGESHWMHEFTGSPGHPLSRSLGREDFIPGFTPWLMLLSAIAALAALAITLLTAAWRWASWRQWRALVPLLIAALLVHHGAGLWKESRARLRPQDPHLRDAHVGPHMTMGHFARWLNPTGETPPITDLALAYYAPEVEWRDAGKIPRAEIRTRIAADIVAARAEQRAYEGLSGSSRILPGGFLHAGYAVVAYRQPPGAPASGEVRSIVVEGHEGAGHSWQITSEILRVFPIYTAEARPLPEAEADAWLGQFAGSLTWTNPALEPLNDFMCPTLFQLGTAPKARLNEHGPRDRALVVASLREYRAQAGNHLNLHRTGPVHPLPGARQRLQVAVHKVETGHVADWTLDLIHSAGRWQIIQFSYTPL